MDLDFVGTWRRNIQILDFQYACITIFVEANDACHDFSSNLQTNQATVYPPSMTRP